MYIYQNEIKPGMNQKWNQTGTHTHTRKEGRREERKEGIFNKFLKNLLAYSELPEQ